MNTTMKIHHLLFVSALLLGTSAALGYEFDYQSGHTIKWDSTHAHLHADSGDFPSGSTLRDILEDAINAWNKNPSEFQFELEYESSTSTNNSRSDIFFVNNDAIFNTGDGVTPGLTYVWYKSSNGEIDRADVLLNDNYDFALTTARSEHLYYQGSHRLLRTTIMHELGHVMGLDHEDDEYNLMGGSPSHVSANDNEVHSGPGEDACDGAVALYGLDSDHREDVGVTHWKYLGSDGEYSTHQRCKLYNSSGTALAVVDSSDPDPNFIVSRGQTIQIEVTLENNGATTQEPTVNFYYSGDANITTGDTQLSTRVPRIARGDVYVIKQTVTLPTTMRLNAYQYVGVIIDPNDVITEVKENNNACYIGIYVSN